MAELNDRYVTKAKELVFAKFPEMDGAKPSVSKRVSEGKGLVAVRQSIGSSTGPWADNHGEPVEQRGGNSGNFARYVVTFERDVPLPGGGKMKRLVRVTMDEAGEVLRLASSK
jgi:hypothetical protein